MNIRCVWGSIMRDRYYLSIKIFTPDWRDREGRGTGKKNFTPDQRDGKGVLQEQKIQERETLFLFSRLYTHSILYAIQIINEIIQSNT